jgi:hypothetical protein
MGEWLNRATLLGDGKQNAQRPRKAVLDGRGSKWRPSPYSRSPKEPEWLL